MTFFVVREPPAEARPSGENVIKSLKDVFSNHPYRLLLTAWFTNSSAAAVMETMLIYYYKYIFRDEGAVTLAMVTLLVVTIVTIPGWVWISKKIGKKNAYILGISLTLLSVIAFAFSADRLGVTGALGLMAIAGIGFSSHYVLPWSMVPDTIEFGYARSGIRREGIYYSVWTFCIAVGGALAGFLVGQGLTLSGYLPDAVQSPSAILGIRLFNWPAARHVVHFRQPGNALLSTGPETIPGDPGPDSRDGGQGRLWPILGLRNWTGKLRSHLIHNPISRTF